MLERRDVLRLLVLGSGLCPALAWQRGVAWIAEVGDPMIHLVCNLLAAWLTLRGKRSGVGLYLLLLPFAAFDLLTAFTSGMNVPPSQIAYVPLLAATAGWGLFAMPEGAFEDDATDD